MPSTESKVEGPRFTRRQLLEQWKREVSSGTTTMDYTSWLADECNAMQSDRADVLAQVKELREAAQIGQACAKDLLDEGYSGYQSEYDRITAALAKLEGQ